MTMRLSVAAICLFSVASSLPAQEKIDFATQIQPILKLRCYRCHGPEKDEGGVRLHTSLDIEDSAAVLPEAPDDSTLFARLTLPEGDEDRMPKGSAPLAKEQIDLIRLWIEQGAEMPEGDHTLLGGEEPDNVPPAPPEAVATLAATGALVMPIAMNTNRLTVSFVGRASEVGDDTMALIAPLAEQVTWLNLARTGVSDAGLAPLATFKNLTQLHLELTGIGDEALAHLAGLEKLEYLNLYGTKVTDAGLEHLAGLKNLKRLYLWQTPVTYEAAMKLEEATEGLEVNLGHDHPGVVRARLTRQIELAKQRKDDAAAREEQAKQEREAAAEQEAEATKELEEFEKQQTGDTAEESEEGKEKPAEEEAAEEEKAEEEKDDADKEEAEEKVQEAEKKDEPQDDPKEDDADEDKAEN
jgi:hypothetical protein